MNGLRDFIAPLLIFLSSCALGGSMDFQEKLETTFPNQNIRQTVQCLIDHKETYRQHCHVSREVLNWRNDDREYHGGNATPAEFLLSERGRGAYFSPAMMRLLAEDGASFDNVVNGLVDAGDLDYYRAAIDVYGGPNGRVGEGRFTTSIMHLTIDLWTNVNGQYLLSLNPDLEQTDGEGRTAILSAATTANLTGESPVINLILDHGGNPRARKKNGEGLCELVLAVDPQVNHRYIWVQELFDRLHSEYGMNCHLPT